MRGQAGLLAQAVRRRKCATKGTHPRGQVAATRGTFSRVRSSGKNGLPRYHLVGRLLASLIHGEKMIAKVPLG